MLRGFTRWFLTYTFPTRLPDPSRLAVPARPGVVRPLPTHTRHLPEQAALSHTALLRQERRWWSFTPTRSCSASWRTVSYWHLVGVAARYGETDAAAAYLLLISVDGLVIVASVSLVELTARIPTEQAHQRPDLKAAAPGSQVATRAGPRSSAPIVGDEAASSGATAAPRGTKAPTEAFRSPAHLRVTRSPAQSTPSTSQLIFGRAPSGGASTPRSRRSGPSARR